MITLRSQKKFKKQWQIAEKYPVQLLKMKLNVMETGIFVKWMEMNG